MSTAAPPRTIRLIVNGKHADNEALREAVEQVRADGAVVEVQVTAADGDAGRFAADALADGIDVIAPAGGDGTLHEVVNGLLVADAPVETALAAVPLGTANDFAAACGVASDDPLTALRIAALSIPRPIDVGRAGDRYFINVASGGFGAEVTARTSTGNKAVLGKVAYFLTGLKHMIDLEACDLTVEADGFRWAGAAYGVAVGNGRQAGGGIHVCPHAKLNDGLLDLLIVPEVPTLTLVDLLNEALTDFEGLTEHEHTVYRQLPALRLTSAAPLQVNLDGEPLTGRSFDFAALPGRLHFCFPTPEAREDAA